MLCCRVQSCDSVQGFRPSTAGQTCPDARHLAVEVGFSTGLVCVLLLFVQRRKWAAAHEGRKLISMVIGQQAKTEN